MRPVFVRCKHLACEIKRAGYHNANRPPGELPAAGKCGLEACDRCRGDAFAMGEFGERGSLVGILLPWNFERRGNFGQSLKVTQKAASVFCGLHADEEVDGARLPFPQIRKRAGYDLASRRVMPAVHPDFRVRRRQLMKLTWRKALQASGPDGRREDF